MNPTLLQALNVTGKSPAANVRAHQFYDRALITNATVEKQFFANGVGQGSTIFTGTAKTYSDTNWPASNYLPNGHRFAIGAIRILLVGSDKTNAAQDMTALLREAIFRAKHAGVEVMGPTLAELLPGGGGVVVGAATTATSEFATHGIADPRAVAGLGSLPIVIEGGKKFEASLTWVTAPGVTASDSVLATVVLDGVLYEPIG